jgi:hypothetical protein
VREDERDTQHTYVREKDDVEERDVKFILDFSLKTTGNRPRVKTKGVDGSIVLMETRLLWTDLSG